MKRSTREGGTAPRAGEVHGGRRHDVYEERLPRKESLVCGVCGLTFTEGRWSQAAAPNGARIMGGESFPPPPQIIGTRDGTGIRER